jgi:2-polyprenyl-3-methyl-5-hydroxy-6-metoxy-1,4-benzoquinol methylase
VVPQAAVHGLDRLRLVDSRQYWDRHAAVDPLWTVLAFPDKSGGRWPLQEFMKTGEREIALLFHRFAELQLPLPRRYALDFGCGVGRLTQALARRHDRVAGADISPVMIDLARRLNRYPDRAEYLCTAASGLDTLRDQSFDCIYSNIVLQHVAPELSVPYLHEFFRLLEPNGLLVFQLPSHRDSPRDAEIKAMPDDAYRGAIALAAPVSPSVAAAAEFAVTLRVRNAGDRTWSQPDVGPLAVGNHWLDATGELMLVQDDGRSPLLQTVPPGLEWPVLLTLKAPAQAGTYVGEIDLVHEGVTWFGHKGSPTLRFTLQVTHDTTQVKAGGEPQMMREFPIPVYPEDVIPRPTPNAAPPARAEFPMHGVPRERVMDIIHEHGGRLAYLEEDRRAGPEWVSYRYFVVGR